MMNSNVLVFSAVQSLPGHRETVRSVANVLGGVALNRKGEVVAPGAVAAGVTLYDVEAGELVAIGLGGVCVVRVTAPAVINPDDPIAVGVGGTGAKAAGTDAILGKSLDMASGASPTSPRFIRVYMG